MHTKIYTLFPANTVRAYKHQIGMALVDWNSNKAKVTELDIDGLGNIYYHFQAGYDKYEFC